MDGSAAKNRQNSLSVDKGVPQGSPLAESSSRRWSKHDHAQVFSPLCSAFVRRQIAGQHTDQGGLATAVRTEQAQARTG